MKVFIDPGHGGDDSGGVGPAGYREEDFTLQTAALLDLFCQWEGWETRWSRQSDINVSESASAAHANRWGANVYISLHANAHENPEAHGMEVLYWNSSAPGRALADRVRDELMARFPHVRDRGNKSIQRGNRGWIVLGKTKMPAILVEPGFITNPDEAAWLAQNATKALIADAVVSAIRHQAYVTPYGLMNAA